MEHIGINTGNESIQINLSVEKIKEIVCELNCDEIFDAIKNSVEQKNYDNKSVIDRVCSDYPTEIGNLLHNFFSHKSDANKFLTAEQQEDLEADFQTYIEKL